MNDKEVVEYIIKDFDFEHVHYVMKLLNWQWAVNGSLSDMEVPSISHLVLSAQRYLTMAVEGARNNKKEYFAASGGFHAIAHYDSESDKVCAQLSFVLESMDNYD